MQTRVTRRFSFEAAHHLPFHQGKCHRLHGHHYRLEVTVEGPLREDGMVIDFDELEGLVEREVLSGLDHQLLNDLIDNPTAELMAHELWKRIASLGLKVVALRLWETPDASVELREA